MGITYNTPEDLNYIFRDEGGVFSGNLAGNIAFDYFRDNCQADDALYFGKNPRFDDIHLYVGTAFVANSVTFAWEYWNGSAWAALSVADGTDGFTSLGAGTVAFVPPDDWRETTVNGTQSMWVRCRIDSVSNPTEGGANSTQKAQAGNNRIQVVDYPKAAPCTLEDLYQASETNGWNVVLKQSRQYLFRARVLLGNGSTETWLADEDKALEFVYLGLPWTSVTLIEIWPNAGLRLGRALDSDNKIGSHGCQLNMGPTVDKSIRTFDGQAKFYGCSFAAADINSQLKGNNHTLWNCQFHGPEVGCYSLEQSDLAHVLFADGATFDETKPDSTLEDITSYRSGGFAFFTYNGGNVIRNWKALGNLDHLIYLYYDQDPVTLVDCESTIWKVRRQFSQQPVYRKYTFNLTVRQPDGSPLEGAQVFITDKNGDPIPGSPFTTDSNGRIPAQEITHAVYEYAEGEPDNTREVLYSPYTLKISHGDYATYQDQNLVLDTAKEMEIALNEVVIQQALNTGVTNQMNALTLNLTLDTPKYNLRKGFE